MSTQPKDLRGLAVLLGIGGLVPFIALAWLCLRDASGSSEYQHSLVVYAACITSFVGAVHWGLVLGEANATRRHALQLTWSVVPSLAAWGATISGEPRTALVRMALVLAACWLTDAVFLRWGAIPVWYFRLRSLLTFVAVASLMLTGLASSG
ncbi:MULTISPECIES: DUF3429 domain-containing protein [Ralstonia]|uniref:DUF3429 domain-containing protein n=1 Tax=Ralstonia chuxiongensis TaxID=2957504 RepID=A0AA41WY92_9RALS|nr:DUF3429 domain-containing protein [Ralstonia chuxiongensis]MCP1175522.1 DUF3429 domain-containing protein [Ralstonia chuxiongensis]